MTDFRSLIESLSRVDVLTPRPDDSSHLALVALTGAAAATTDAESGATEANSDPQTSTDLQAAVAAMSMLPWPVSTPPPPASAGCEVSGVEDPVSAVVARGAPQYTQATIVVPDATPAPMRAAAKAVDTAQSAQSPANIELQPDALLPLPTTSTAGMRREADQDFSGSSPERLSAPQQFHAVAESRASFAEVMTAVATGAKTERAVSVPVHDARWSAAISNEVRWCAQAGVQSATLKLVPDNLGPIELHVDLQDNRVNVSFVANHAETRTALEQSLPRLRELLAGSGLALGQATVQQEARRDSQSAVVTPRFAEQSGDDRVRSVRMTIGLVDEYA
jgi:flagellar hook-length control protein FliK